MEHHSKDELYLEFDAARIHFAEEEEEEEEEASYVVSLKDITDRVQAEILLYESEERFRRIFETANEGICVLDKKENILSVNQKFADMLGFTVNELLNKSFESLLFKEDLEDIKEKILDRKEGKTGIYERRLRKKDESVIWCIVSATPIIDSDGLYNGSFAMFTDITERKQMVADLIAAKENAEEANRLKSGFISAMSHEIRTPLNIILGYSGVIRDLFDIGQNEEYKLYFDSIEKSGLRLINTITQILDISRIEVDEFPVNLHPISINQAVRSSVDQLKILVKEKRIALRLLLSVEEPKVIADDYCLNGVLINIINNSIKYSTDGEILITTVIENDLVRCIIRDQGIGMSEKYQRHLFETFSQENVGINRPYEGTGLGLSLTKRYLELMNGKIKIKSKKNVGTTVEIFLPLAK